MQPTQRLEPQTKSPNNTLCPSLILRLSNKDPQRCRRQVNWTRVADVELPRANPLRLCFLDYSFLCNPSFPLIEVAGLAGVYHTLKMDIDQSNQS